LHQPTARTEDEHEDIAYTDGDHIIHGRQGARDHLAALKEDGAWKWIVDG
jgi:hypothetical protein